MADQQPTRQHDQHDRQDQQNQRDQDLSRHRQDARDARAAPDPRDRQEAQDPPAGAHARQQADPHPDVDGLADKKPDELTPEELRLMADTMPGEGPGD